MEIKSTGIQKGYFQDIYGGNGSKLNENGIPNYSIPFSIYEAPKETKSFAAVLYDLDAYQSTKGFPWIHWTIANLTKANVLANESQSTTEFVQGVNSWHSPLSINQTKELSSCYGGMTPHDGSHMYTLKIFALDTVLSLENGFYLNELVKSMREHILATATLEANYAKIKTQ